MMIDDIERYIATRRAAGHAFKNGARDLRSYGEFAASRGDSHVRRATALDWAASGASPHARDVRMRHVVQFARFQRAEDAYNEVPPRDAFAMRWSRPLPYIYSDDEIALLLAATDRLRLSYKYPLRRATYRTMIGLMTATGLRKCEVLDLLVHDLSTDGVLTIRCTKFRKSRLVPLHPTTHAALRRYIDLRSRHAIDDDHLFVSAGNGRIDSSVINYTFRRILVLAQIALTRARRPRVHDLRHTFATRAFEKCSGDRRAIAKQFVALSTYLGHTKASATQWYLEATPELMIDIASAAETELRGVVP